eukprot:PhM_4_TR5440/c0_g1_i1/m.68518
MATGPTIRPFSYVLIPTDDAKSLELRRHDRCDDEVLREEIAGHFRQFGMTKGQIEEYKANVQARAEEQHKKQAAGQSADMDAATKLQMDASVAQMIENNTTKFEIVPVVMPGRANGFVGVSLYIDEVGRFKELPLNGRASKIAQRDIRGDAFLLSNHDDPACDEWGRVDTTVEKAVAMISDPPPMVPDPMANMAGAASASSKLDTVVLTPEDVDAVAAMKQEGNTHFQSKDYGKAKDTYTAALAKTEGRADRLSPEQQTSLLELIVSLHMNRAQCGLRLREYRGAVDDTTHVLQLRGNNHLKAFYARASANLALGEFGAAYRDLDAGLALVRDDPQFLELYEQVRHAERSYKETQKARFGKMFA